MARPRKDEQDKKHVLNIRVSYSTKNEVEAAAEREGIPVSHKAEQLINAMLELSDRADSVTLDLLSAIVAEIGEVQSRAEGIWHEDLKTWAAVSEMLMRGPIVKWKPPSGLDDAAANKAYDELTKIKLEKRSLISTIKLLGVEISSEPNPKVGGLSGNYSYRKAEREKIETLADDATKQKALMLFEMIEDADAKEKRADDYWTQLLKPYFDAEREGRDLFRAYRKEIAMQQLSSGIKPRFEDLLL